MAGGRQGIFYLAPGNVLTAVQVDLQDDGLTPTGSETLLKIADSTQELWQGFLVLENGQRFLIPEDAATEDPGTGSLVLASDWRIGLNR